MVDEKKTDFHKEMQKAWADTSRNLRALGEETKKIAKKGERELVKVSKKGKIQMDIWGLNVKKERLVYQIGKKVVEQSKKGKMRTDVLRRMCQKVDVLDGRILNDKTKIKGVR